MAFANLSFEDALGDTSGGASAWTFSCTSQTEAANFDGIAIEDFDHWPGPIQTTLIGTPAAFDTSGQLFEDFEQEWSGNEAYLFGLAGTAANFDTTPEPVEDFEESWSSNESYKYAYVGVGTDLNAGAFDVTPENFEDFEEDWSSNQSYKYSYVGVGTDLTAANFDTSPEAFEDFEEDWTTEVMTSI